MNYDFFFTNYRAVLAALENERKVQIVVAITTQYEGQVIEHGNE